MDPSTYLKTKVMTSSPAELRLMLLDGAIKFVQQAIQGVNESAFESVYEGVSRSQAILTELMSSLRPEHDPELCERLNGLYTYVFNLLVKANGDMSAQPLEEALKLLEYERETWLMLMERTIESNEQSGNIDSVPAAGEQEERPGKIDGIVGNRLSVQG